MLTLRCLSSPRAGPSRAGSSGTVVSWQAKCPQAAPHCSLPGRGDPTSPLYAPCSDSIIHLPSFTDVMTGNVLKLSACSQQRDSGRHPSSRCCRHETTAPCTTARMVPCSWLTSKIVKVTFADNCIHYEFFVCFFIKLIKPLWFFPSTKEDKLYFLFSTEKPRRQFQASCQGPWMAGVAGDTGRGHLPSGGWV